MPQDPIVVAFRFDAATADDARAVIEAIQAAGIVIVPHHSYRTKRHDEGVFWDGQIVVGDSPTVVQAEATRIANQELPPSSTVQRRTGERRPRR